MPKFSILTSSYNGYHFLKDWSNSILEQSYRPLEVIFVDDCSQHLDDIGLVESMRPMFEEAGIELVTHHNTKNLHCAASYLEALKLASGEFFGVLDSDDALCPHSVADVMKLYQKHRDVGYIYTQFDWCNYGLKRKRTGFCKQPPKGVGILENEFTKSTRHIYSHWRTFSRRVPELESIFKAGMTCSIDKYMGYRLEELAPGMFYKKVCYRYRGGVKSGITKQQNSIGSWKEVREDAFARRKDLNIRKIYPVSQARDVSK